MASNRFVVNMHLIYVFALILCLLPCLLAIPNNDRKFPDGFMFGVASSAYQTEGAWNVSGKGVNVWDDFVHTDPTRILDGTSGDVACDSYHKFKQDIDLVQKLGVGIYRFSISWSRILPTGFSNNVNKEGIAHYNIIINELKDRNIEPMVTMYHFDLPLPLQKLGGWNNPLMVQYFEDYANVLLSAFGDRVKYWITINEPTMECRLAYGAPAFAPGLGMEPVADYLCIHHQILAHANVYHLYKNKYDTRNIGKMSYTNHIITPVVDPKYGDANADPNFVLEYMSGIESHPVYSKTGDYPESVKKLVEERSKAEGYPRSRLPKFTQEQLGSIKGTADFFALSHYSSVTYLKDTGNLGETLELLELRDLGLKIVQDPSWPKAGSKWIAVYPKGMRDILNWIKNTYDNPMVFITENGISYNAKNETLLDLNRVEYITSYLSAILDAIYIDGCNVQGYIAWSLMDSYEWQEGYTNNYGLHCVDFNNPDLPRSRKMSAFVYEDIARNGKLRQNYDYFISRHMKFTPDVPCRSRKQ